MEFEYQKYTLKQIETHNKIMLLWFKSSGKSNVIVDAIINYISKSHNKNVYVFTQDKRTSKVIQCMLHSKLNIPNNLSNTSYLNNCVVKFKCENLTHYEGFDTDFVIYYDFEYIKNVDLFSYMLDRNKPKILLTSSHFITEVILHFDRNGDYYLNIISASSVFKNEEITEMKKRYGDSYNTSHEYGNIEQLYSELGIEKDRNLIDMWNMKKLRKMKLEEITKNNKKSNLKIK